MEVCRSKGKGVDIEISDGCQAYIDRFICIDGLFF
jgi:hypothetical protein